MKIFIAAIILIFIGGCTTRTTVLESSDYSAFKDESLVLKRPVLVCIEKPLKSKSSGNIKYRLLYNINNISACPFGSTAGKLDAGSELLVHEVEAHHQRLKVSNQNLLNWHYQPNEARCIQFLLSVWPQGAL